MRAKYWVQGKWRPVKGRRGEERRGEKCEGVNEEVVRRRYTVERKE
jgi:hypothetical protein